MAPKLAVGDSKSAQKVRDAITETGAAITGETIGTIPPDLRRKAFGALRYFTQKFPSHEMSKEFGGAETDAAKRDIVARYLVDAKNGTLQAKNSTTVSHAKANEDAKNWFHMPELAKEMGGDETLAELVSKSLPSRKSEYKEAAARGWLQYKFIRKTEIEKGTIENKAEISVTADIDELQYEVIKADMDMQLGDGPTVDLATAAESVVPSVLKQEQLLAAKDEQVEPATAAEKKRAAKANGGGKTPGKRRRLDPPNLTEEEESLKQIRASFDDARDEAKKLLVRINSELDRVALAEARLMKKEGWGESAVKFIQAGTATQKTLAMEFSQVINKVVLFTDEHEQADEDNKAEFIKMVENTSKEHVKFEAAYKADVNKVLGEFAKYTN